MSAISIVYINKWAIKNRPPVYLLTEDLISLENYSKIRTQMRNNKKRDYLIVGDSGAEIYGNKLLGACAILRKVKQLTSYIPKQFRITCFQSLSAIFGQLLLIDAFGLSKTQSSRYVRFGEYLVEKEIKEQRD